MAKGGSEGRLEITGLDELIEHFEEAVKEAPEKHEKLLKTLGDTVLKLGADEVKKSGAIASGYLLASYQKKNRRHKLKVINKRKVYIAVTAPHSHLIEYGHIQKVKQADGTLKEVGFVPGRLIFKGAMERVEKQLPETVELFIEDVLGKVF